VRGADSKGDGEMETLTQMKCVACRKDAPTMTDSEIAEFHPQRLGGLHWRTARRVPKLRTSRTFWS